MEKYVPLKILTSEGSIPDQLSFESARDLIVQGKIADGIAKLIALAENGSSCPSVYDELSNYAEAKEDPESALALLNAAQALSFSLDRCRRQVQFYRQIGDIDSTLATLGTLIRANVGDHEALHEIKATLEASTQLSEITWARLVADLRYNNIAQKENQRLEGIVVDLQKQLANAHQILCRPKATAVQSISVHRNSAITLAFIVQYAAVWPSLRSVWRFAHNDSRFSTIVVLSPFIHPFSDEKTTYEEMRSCLNSENVPYCTSDNFDYISANPHVVFLQNPYEETRPLHLRTPALRAVGARIAYVPYGLEIGGGDWNITAQFDSELQRSAWRIFARSERHKALFGRYCRAGNQHVVVTGHPKFDSGEQTVDAFVEPDWTAKIKERKVILWTPHFSESAIAAWSTFCLYGNHIFSEANRRTDIFFLVRPHPLFFKAMRNNNVWLQSEEDNFRKHISKSSNMALDESTQYQYAFRYSSALMADVGSFLLEYLPSEKPILYLRHPEGLGMNDDGDLARFLYVANSPKEITNFITMVSRGEDQSKNTRLQAIPDFLYGLDGKSGQRICEHIYSELGPGTSFPTLDVHHETNHTSLDNTSQKTATNLPRVELDFVVLWVGTKCTLSCRDCGNLIPYVKQVSYEIDNAISDLQALTRISSIKKLQIQGGEPFSHKDFHKLIARLDELEAQEIVITTNGTAHIDEITITQLLNVKRPFKVAISQYDAAKNRQDSFYRKLRHHGISVEKYAFYKGDGGWVDQGGPTSPRNNCDEEVQKIYDCCAFRCCVSLAEGRVFRCGRGPTSAEHYGLTYSEGHDFFDVRKTYDSSQAATGLQNFIDNKEFKAYCRHCKGTFTPIPAGIQLAGKSAKFKTNKKK